MRHLISCALFAAFALQLPPTIPPEGIRGTVRTDKGPAPDGLTVVFFPEDQALWTTPAGQKLLITVSVTRGEYAIGPVPAGKYRICVIKDDAKPAAIDAAFLAKLLPSSIPVPYTLGERRTLDLVVSAEAISRIVSASGSSLIPNPVTIGPRTIVPGAPPVLPPSATAQQGPGAISGTLIDADGRPVAGVQIMIMRRVLLNNVPQMAGYGAPATTDANGSYRITGIAVGPAFIVALAYPFAVVPGSAPATTMPPATVAADGTKLGYVTTFFPGVAGQSGARPVMVGEAEVTHVDFALARVPVVDVTGRISGVDSNIRTNAPLFVLPSAILDQLSGRNMQRVTVNPDGTFVINGLAFGNYSISYNGASGWIRESLEVSRNAAPPLALKLSPYLSVSGRLEFKGERASVTAAEISQFDVRLNAVPLTPGSPLLRAQVSPAGEFTIARVPAGRYALQVASPAPWIEIAGVLNGRDTLDFPVDLTADSKDAVITFVDRETAVRGFARDAQGAPMTDTLVVIFSSDPQFWTTGSRRVRSTRTLPGGSFTVSGLPPGQYLAAVVRQVPLGATLWSTAFLQPLVAKAYRFDLLSGQMRTIDLVWGSDGGQTPLANT